MAINLNRFDSAGLAAVAGNSMPNYSLENHAIKGGEFFKELAAQNNASRGMDINQQQVDQQGQYQQGQLANDTAKNAIMQQTADQQGAADKEKQRVDQLKLDIEDRKSKGVEENTKIQTATGSVMYAMHHIDQTQGMSSEEKAQAKKDLQTQTLQIGYKEGKFTKDQLVQYSKMDPDMFTNQVIAPEFIKSNAAIRAINSKAALDPKLFLEGANTKQTGSTRGTADERNVDRVTEMTHEIETQKAAGQTPDPALVEARDTLANLNKAKGARGNPEALNNAEQAKTNAKIVYDVSTSNATIPPAIDSINRVEKILNDNPNLPLGPINEGIDFIKRDPKGQELLSNLTSMMYSVKNAQKLGSNGFTDKDSEIAYGINGDATKYSGTIKDLMKQARSTLQHLQVDNWIRERDVKQTMPKEYNRWLEQHPEPEILMGDAEGKNKHYVKASQRNLILSKGGKVLDE